MKWIWIATCDLCGYKSRYYRREWIANVVSILHSITQHPYGHMRVGCVDEKTHTINQAIRSAFDSEEK